MPDTIVIDNGTQFVSKVFENFCVKFNIVHLTSPVFHPASNGEAERFVQTFKHGIDENVKGGKSLVDSVRFVLSSYRCLPHPCLDWLSPAEVLHGRQPKNLLSLFSPNANNSKLTVTENEKESSRKPKFSIGDSVYARNYASGAKWFPGVITKVVGNILYIVRTKRGLWKRHQNQLQYRLPDMKSDSEPNAVLPQFQSDISNDNRTLPEAEIEPSTSGQQRYPSRIRRPPNFYQAGFT